MYHNIIMSYRNSIGFNKQIYNDNRETFDNEKLVRVVHEEKNVKYLYVNNLTLFTSPIEYPYKDGLFIFNLSYGITPKYMKLEYLMIPNTYYPHSNSRKIDANPVNPLTKQNAPLRMVWRESNGGPEVLYNLPLTPGNYTMDEFIQAIEDIMNTSVNNTYSITFDDITMKATITQLTGTYFYSLWFATYQENLDYYNNDIETLVSDYFGYSIIPLDDPYTTVLPGIKISPLVLDQSGEPGISLEIEGTPSIIQSNAIDSNIATVFNATFVLNQNGNRGDFSIFTINKDYDAIVYFANKISFQSMTIRLRSFNGNLMHFNGASPYMLFSYVEYETNENFNIVH